jgi:hypothetical protein
MRLNLTGMDTGRKILIFTGREKKIIMRQQLLRSSITADFIKANLE